MAARRQSVSDESAWFESMIGAALLCCPDALNVWQINGPDFWSAGCGVYVEANREIHSRYASMVVILNFIVVEASEPMLTAW